MSSVSGVVPWGGTRSEEGDWRRQDATEVWYFAEKSSHCLKVDGVTPRRKITSGAASINSLLPHAHSRNHPYLRSEGNSSSIILVPTLPPTLSSSLVLSYTAFRVATIRFIRPPPIPLLRISLELNLFLRHSVCHAILMNDKFMELTRNKAEFICISEKVHVHVRVSFDTSVRHGDCRNCLSPKISSFRVDDTSRRRFAGEILMFLILRPGQESAPRIEEVLILSIKIY